MCRSLAFICKFCKLLSSSSPSLMVSLVIFLNKGEQCFSLTTIPSLPQPYFFPITPTFLPRTPESLVIKCLLFLLCPLALLALWLSWRSCKFDLRELAAHFHPLLGEELSEMVLFSFPVSIFGYFLYPPPPIPMISISLFTLVSF